MPAGDRALAAMVIAADVDEVGVLGERLAERVAVGRVPRVLQLLPDLLAHLACFLIVHDRFPFSISEPATR